MKKRYIIAIVCLTGLCTSCGHRNDFLDRTAKANNPGLSVSTDMEEKQGDGYDEEMADEKMYSLSNVEKVSDTMTEGLKNAGIDVVEYNGGGVEIDIDRYAGKKLENLGYELVSSNGNTQLKIIDDLVCEVNEQGVIRQSYHILLSENESVRPMLEELGLLEEVEKIDKEIIEITDKKMSGENASVSEFGYFSKSCYGGRFEYGYRNISYKIYPDNKVICESVKWITDYYAGDNWLVQRTVSNSVCDTAVYYTGVTVKTEGEYIDKDICMYVYGKENVIQEIKLELYDGHIPKKSRDTVIAYLQQLGMNHNEAENFVTDIPKKDGTISGIQYYVSGNTVKISK